MKVDASTIEGLSSFLKEHLEADIVAEIAVRKGVSANEAMEIYFNSKIATAVEEGAFGMQYLPASYLAEEILK